MIDFAAGLASLVAGTVGFAGGLLLRKPHREAVPVEPDLCTGYQTEDYFKEKSTKRDCQALRSATCIDGRCSFHCRQMCKCDASNAPEFIGQRTAE